MRFTDGFWLMRERCAAPRTRPRSAMCASTPTGSPRTRRSSGSTRRGDTLNTPLITVECFSPAEGVIGVRTTHHAGKAPRGPGLRTAGRTTPRSGATHPHADGAITELTSGPLTLRLHGDGALGPRRSSTGTAGA